MALVLREIYKLYRYALDEVADPRVKEWPLLDSPWPVLALTGFYLYVILNWGPKLMRDRKAFDIDRLLIWYNAVQIAACAFIVVEGTRLALRYNYMCANVDYSDDPDSVYAASLLWCYFMIKVIDLLDTVFFIMRKKESQISFLHVYHHWGMVNLSWFWLKFVGGGATVYIVVLNSFVHVIMYSYYLLCAYDKEFKKSAWWKKHITQLQLTQFGVLMTQHLYMLFTNCEYPKPVLILYIIQGTLFLFLFGDFYYKAYIKKKPKKAVE